MEDQDYCLHSWVVHNIMDTYWDHCTKCGKDVNWQKWGGMTGFDINEMTHTDDNK